MKRSHVSDKSIDWRIGILATTLTMGIALLVTGFSGYIQAEKNAKMLAAAEIGAMMVGLRRELSRRPENIADALTGFLASDEDSGFTAAALLTPGGEVTQIFGKNKKAFARDFLLQPPGRLREPALRLYENGVVHAVFETPPHFGRRHGGKRRAAKKGPHDGLRIAVEAISKSGPTIISNAVIALVIETVAAVLLLSSALLFLRQKALADRRARLMEIERREMAVQLERDERLKALGRMSAVLGHELKNPIASLKGHAQLLLENLEKEHPGRPRAATVVEEAELLETLTLQVLDFVRTGELSCAKVYLDDLAESAAALSGVDSVTVRAPEGKTWHLDRARMEQALVNLLINAAQASPPGAPIDISIQPTSDMLDIQVRDRGDGIPPEDLDRIFQPFFTSRAQGTGLGLALVQRIAVAHGGRVTARNHPDGGAVFILELPPMR